MRVFLSIIFSISILFASSSTPLEPNQKISKKTTIIVGIRAWKGVDMAYKEWGSTIQYLNENVDGYEFKLYPLVKYNEVKDKIKNKVFDFLICDPVLYVEAENLYGVTRLATLQRKAAGFYFDKFGSVIFTASKNRNINTLKDLKGTTFMGVAEAALAGYRMAYRELLSQGIVPETTFKDIIFSGGRGDVVVEEVLKNDNYVGTVRTGLLESMLKTGVIKKTDFKIINQIKYDYFPMMASTKLYPEFPFSRLAHVPEELGKEVLIALLSIQENSIAAKDGKYARWLIPNDYSDITNLMKELNVGIYKDFNTITIQKVIEKYWIAILGTFTFILLLIFLSIRIKRQAIALEEEKDKVTKILDSQDSIVILTDGKKINVVNQKFLEFFNINALAQFSEKYDCICEIFEYEEGKDYIQKFHKGKNWNNYIKSTPEEIHKVKIKDLAGNDHTFKVNLTSFDKKQSLDIVTLHDITDIEILEEKNIQNTKLLYEQSKMVALGEMIGNIAHQWRQPLSIISTLASGAKLQKMMAVIDDDKLFDSLDKINDTAHEMSKTIDDFRDFLNGHTHKTVFNLTDEIEKCLDLEDGILTLHHIKVIKNLDNSISLNNISHGLSQAIVNIINNAKDAMIKLENKEHRLLFIETKIENDIIEIILKDSGGGIDNNIINKVFEPYFTTKHQSQGTGLGLHMTYNIITESMNGTIEVKNEAYIYNDQKYTGACFIIKLPNM